MGSDMNEIKSMFERMTVEMENFIVRQSQVEQQYEKAFAELKESIDEARRFDRDKEAEGVEKSGEIYTPSENHAALVPNTQGAQFSLGGYQLGMGLTPSYHVHGEAAISHAQPMNGTLVGAQGGGITNNPSVTVGVPGGVIFHSPSTSTSHGSSSMTRFTKMEFPHFNESNLRTWLCKVDQYFSMDEVTYNQRVKVASIHFDDVTIE
ncbi:hypothetical protein K7X08_026185 [Anisodus acutangulus]|uniref:Uncharacterized protein n=1 Tax=Anisodus acutangulus TaxID=402998 RepID=A0A9Q1N2M4_9SOLA|nr:hypothetical protein K7X08_026185 [Anisodus acutangulus]